jgi:hypothetical protein
MQSRGRIIFLAGTALLFLSAPHHNLEIVEFVSYFISQKDWTLGAASYVLPGSGAASKMQILTQIELTQIKKPPLFSLYRSVSY